MNQPTGHNNKAQSLDIIDEGHSYTLIRNDKPMLTPAGESLSHENSRILYFIFLEILQDQSVSSYSLSGYGMFSFEIDFIRKGKDPVLDHLEEIIEKDDYVRLRTSVSQHITPKDTQAFADYFLLYPELLTLKMGSSALTIRSFNAFLDEHGFLSQAQSEDSFQLLKEFLTKEYLALTIAHKAAINLLYKHFHCGIVLPLLLLYRYLSPTEFSAVLWQKALENSPTPDVPDHLRETIKPTATITEFLSLFEMGSKEENTILQLIGTGESEMLEFKSSLRWNLREQKKDPAIEHATLKTMAAFLNSTGGTLLLGVSDQGSIEGVESDGFENDDKFNLHLWNLIKAYLGQEFTPYLQTSLIKIRKRTVCLVRCMKSPSPVFLNQKGFDEEFYIRTGPMSTKLGVGDAYKYIRERFQRD